MYTYKLDDGRLVAEGDIEGTLGELLNTEIDNYLIQYGEADNYLNMINVVFDVFDGIDRYEVDTFMFEEAKYEDNSVPVIDGGMVDISGDDVGLEVEVEDNVAVVFAEYEQKVKRQQEELEQVRLQVEDCDEAKRKLSTLNDEIRRIQEHVRSFKGVVEDEFFVQNIADYVGEIVEEAKKLKERIVELETSQQQVQPTQQQAYSKVAETPKRRSSVNMDFMTPQTPQRPVRDMDEFKEPQIPFAQSSELKLPEPVDIIVQIPKVIHPALRYGAKWWAGPYDKLLELQIQLNEGQISDDEFKRSYGVLRQQILDSRYELEVNVADIVLNTLRIFVDYIRENGVNEQSTRLYLIDLEKYVGYVLDVINAENSSKDYVKLKRSLDTLKSHLRNLLGVEDMNEELIRLNDLIVSIERQIRELRDKGLVIGPSVVDSVSILDQVYGYE